MLHLKPPFLLSESQWPHKGNVIILCWFEKGGNPDWLIHLESPCSETINTLMSSLFTK